MNVALRRPMTLEEFLAWERQQELRYEFDGIQPIPMTGSTLAHAIIVQNVLIALFARLDESCQPFATIAKVLVAGRVRYPDVVVTCSAFDGGEYLVPEPVAVFEVLSASTAEMDRKEKATEYKATDSIQHYVLLEQRRPEVVVLSRAANWSEEPVSGLDGIVRLPALGVELPMAELYRRVRFDG